jgi:hypothetical protein
MGNRLIEKIDFRHSKGAYRFALTNQTRTTLSHEKVICLLYSYAAAHELSTLCHDCDFFMTQMNTAAVLGRGCAVLCCLQCAVLWLLANCCHANCELRRKLLLCCTGTAVPAGTSVIRTGTSVRYRYRYLHVYSLLVGAGTGLSAHTGTCMHVPMHHAECTLCVWRHLCAGGTGYFGKGPP